MKKILITIFLLFFTQLHAQPFTLILDWFANPTDGPILVAQEQGFFQREGLDVKIINPADPNDTAKMVALGKADMGVGSDPHLILDVDQGLPLLRAGGILNQPMVAVVSYNSPRLQDLKGKTIGYPVGDLDKFILSVMLHHVGLTLSDVNLIDVHFNLVQALLSKHVDAITGAMRDYELLQVKMAGMHVYHFYPEDYGMPRYAELNYIINQHHRHDPRVKIFLKAIRLATKYLQQHPNAAWRGMIKQYPQLNTPLDHKSWQMTYPLFAKNPAATNQQSFMKLAKLMHKMGWINHVYTYQQYSL